MTRQQRLVLIVSILATLLSGLDVSIVNVALPAIARELGGGLITQQWVSSAYAIMLGALILVAGSLSDIFGRQKILRWGIIGFCVTSIMCAAAPSAEVLIFSRGVQGIFGALLIPSSLALILASFSGPVQAKAIGTWTAWGAVAFLVGPLLGGLLVDAGSWRWIFLINIVPTIVTLWLLRGITVDKRDPESKVDGWGAILCTVGLTGIVFALIDQPNLGWAHPLIYMSLAVGIVALLLFLRSERKVAQPMLPLSLFTVRNFTVGNLATLSIYAGLAVSTFLITIFLQQVAHYSAFDAGISLLPVTVIMFVMSPRFGALAGRYGPRLFMSAGPLTAAIGFLLFLLLDEHSNYLTQVLPGVLMFGLGLSMTVAPLTAAVLGTITKEHAGIGSAVNNAVARIAGLLAISSVGLITGAVLTVAGYHHAVFVMSGLLAAGGAISAIGIVNPERTHLAPERKTPTL